MSSLSKGNLSEIADIYSGIQNSSSTEQNLTEEVEVASEQDQYYASLVVLSTLAEHLIENKLAEDFEECFKIFENMSDEWVEQILEERLEANCQLIEEQIQELSVIQEGDRDLGGLGILASGISGGLNLLQKGWRASAPVRSAVVKAVKDPKKAVQAVTQSPVGRAVGYTKGQLVKGVKQAANIPQSQRVAPALTKKVVDVASRNITGGVRRAYDVARGVKRGATGAMDIGGGYAGDIGRLVRGATGGPKRRLATALAATAGLDYAVHGDKSTTKGLIDLGKSYIPQVQQQLKPQQSKPEETKPSNGDKKKNWCDQI